MPKKKAIDVSTKEAHAYTPGLKVKKGIQVSKTRTLPILGEVLVNEGDEVGFDSIVAKALVPGKPTILKAADTLGVAPENLLPFMLKRKGDNVKEGELVAKYTPFWGLVKRFLYAPSDGVIEAVSDITGQVIMREPPTPVEVDAYVPGKITEVVPQMGVTIETHGAFVQGIFGIGGEAHGQLCIVSESQDEILNVDDIRPEHKGKIVVGGSFVALEAFKKAHELGVKGIIVGGIRGTDISEFLGYEIGVAITGHEDINLTLIATEGFGRMNMSARLFNMLKEFDGYEAAVNGATQIRAGVIRPEIIIPHNISAPDVEDELSGGMKPGTLVRIIREPYFGKIGSVVSLPVHLQKVETMSHVRVVEVEIGEDRVVVPRANVEIIEE